MPPKLQVWSMPSKCLFGYLYVFSRTFIHRYSHISYRLNRLRLDRHGWERQPGWQQPTSYAANQPNTRSEPNSTANSGANASTTADSGADAWSAAYAAAH